ncbi:MAG: hypothetical protein LUH11_03510, partial [Candidatus Gastranaerophilales bacterium]|nr:hypothetical protein [Candidatus Gastranaerophilales bacterium]
IIYNGNPVRKAFFSVTKEEAREKLLIPEDKKVIFAMGGSQGAKTINTAMINILKELSENLNAFVILQTGKKKFEDTLIELETVYPEYRNNNNIMIRPYFDEMVYPLKASDLVISRAGSLSLTEIIQCHAASILIPYPYAAQDHQRKNAKEMCSKGAALYLEDNECSGINLLNKIKEIINTPDKLDLMRENAENLARINPAEAIVKQLKSIIK